MKLHYLANLRLPTEKAHGLQILQMCEAFAISGAEVTLFAPRRKNTPEMSRVKDVWAYYGVSRCVRIELVGCIDLLHSLGARLVRTAFLLQAVSYLVALVARLLGSRADVYYSRDALTLLGVSFIRPHSKTGLP